MASEQRNDAINTDSSFDYGPENFQPDSEDVSKDSSSAGTTEKDGTADDSSEVTKTESDRRRLSAASAVVDGFVNTAHSEIESVTHSSDHVQTSALETLVRTACETLAVSTVLSEHSPPLSQSLDATNKETSKNPSAKELVTMVTEGVSTNCGGTQNIYTTAGVNEVRSSDTQDSNNSVLSMIFGQARERVGFTTENTDEQGTSEQEAKEQQYSDIDLTYHPLSDGGDAEVNKDNVLDQASSEDLDARRLSERERKRKPIRFQSPEGDLRPKKKRKRRLNPALRPPRRDPEIPFKCDLCGSPYVINPSRRGNRPKMSSHQPSPRHKVDPTTGKTLTLCNACGLSFDRPKKPRRERSEPDPEEKKKYLDEANQFAMSLVEGLGDPDAARLCCPHFKFRACGCLQSYIIGDGSDMQQSRERASDLLQLLKKAKTLSSQKCYDPEEARKKGKSKRSKNIGLGNGQRKSSEFEEFVLDKRKYLRETLKFCERATQRVLLYSNNFLHKKLKTDPSKPLRIIRQKGKAALGKLKEMEDLPKERCCVDNCVMIALTHTKLLKQWRDRAVSGQTEARRVLAEMLTPSGGARSNCYKFISWVTGCSHSTIGRVNEQMKETGGDREPPSHGLIKWWQENPKPKKPKVKPASEQQAQVDTVQQVALHQIQQAIGPQVTNILQAAVSSAGLSAVMMQPAVSSGVPTLTTVNSSQLAQAQLLPAVTFTNGAIQVQAAPIQIQATQQLQVPPVQVQVQQQLQQQQLQQQQLQYQQQIQQLQYQQIQLQQQQQQLQQQLQQTQQLQHQASQQLQAHVVHQLQPVQQIQQPTSQTQPQEQQNQQQTTQQTTQQADSEETQPNATITMATSNTLTTATLQGNLTSTQTGPLNADGFLTTDTFLLSAVQPQVVTLPVSPQATVTQAVPVSLLQNSNSQQNLQ